jgi:membrane protease YdiL (CAAX protease family)
VPTQPSPVSNPPITPDRTAALGAWGWGSTGMTVIAAILFGGFIQLVFVLLNHHWGDNTSKEVDTGIAILVTFYAIVGAIVVQRVTVGRVRLFWTDGKPLEGVLIGAGIGLGLGFAALLINSAIAGHLATDPWATMMTSEGDAPHILVAILLSMIAAPLVEESLFRGLFAESLRPKGLTAAIWLSGVAFAFWHWRFSELRYYSLMGAMFAVLYFKRGLICSMTTHACFNGVLTVAAITLALQPGATFTFDGVSVSAPRGWHHASDREGLPTNLLGLDGPSGSAVAFMSEPLPPTVRSITDPSVISRLQSRLGASSQYGEAFDTSKLITLQLPAGSAVEVPFFVGGYHADEVFLQAQNKLVILIYHSAGSAKADHDFQQMLQTLRVN